MSSRRNEPCFCGSKEVEINLYKLHKIYVDGKTLKELSELIGVPYYTIGRWFKKHNFPLRSRSEAAKGHGKPYLTKDGYIEIWDGKKRILEHRYIMQEYIGRELKNDEIVHHIDGNKQNNSINNLKLLNKHRKEHKLPENVWSRNFDCCINCGCTDRKHSGNGLCSKCYQYLWEVKKRGYESIYDENGKRIFSEEHIQKLKEKALIRERSKKFKKCCMPKILAEKYKNFTSLLAQKEFEKESIYYYKKYRKMRNEKIQRDKTA